MLATSPRLDGRPPSPAPVRTLLAAPAAPSAASTDMMRALMTARAEQQARALDPAIARELGRRAGAAAPAALAAAPAPEDYAVPKQRLSGMGETFKARSKRRSTSRSSTPGAASGFNSFMMYARAGWREELFSLKFRQALVAEFLATAFFVATGTLGVMFTSDSLNGSVASVNGITGPLAGGAIAGVDSVTFSDGKFLLPPGVTSLGISLTYTISRLVTLSLLFGLMICILVFATGAISGGNLNPAVTLTLLAVGKMSYLRAICYIIAQCGGAIAGAYYASSLSPVLFAEVGGAVTSLNPQIFTSWGSNLWAAVGGEMVGTGLLVFTVCCAADVGRERNHRYVGALTPLMIGFSVLVCHLFLLPVTGCSLNPARSLGSAVVANKWEYHWVYWVGPILGGLAAGLIYDRIFYTGVSDAPKLTPAEAAGLPPSPTSADARPAGGDGEAISPARSNVKSVAIALAAAAGAIASFAARPRSDSEGSYGEEGEGDDDGNSVAGADYERRRTRDPSSRRSYEDEPYPTGPPPAFAPPQPPPWAASAPPPPQPLPPWAQQAQSGGGRVSPPPAVAAAPPLLYRGSGFGAGAGVLSRLAMPQGQTGASSFATATPPRDPLHGLGGGSQRTMITMNPLRSPADGEGAGPHV